MVQFHRALLLAFLSASSDGAKADDELPSALIRVPESIGTVFVAETSSAKFYRIRQVDGVLIENGSFYMSIGQLGDGKEQAGDKRTPLGAYFVTEQLDTARLHEKYGVTAFPLDYPNAWDRRLGRDGDGIWVHGVDPSGGVRPRQDTDGCIALPNADLLSLIPDFVDNATPVLVTRKIEWVSESQIAPLRTELEGRVTAWSESQVHGDLYTYLGVYDDEFSRWGMSKAEWSALVLQNEALKGSSGQTTESVSVDDLMLLAYPEEEGLYLSRFRLTVVGAERQITSIVRLYWRRDAEGVLRIIAESNG